MRRVLVIDDHVPSRANLKRALAASGCQVVGEGTKGKGAEELASATVPDVILMAVGLADLDGIRAARKTCRQGRFRLFSSAATTTRKASSGRNVPASWGIF